MANPPQSLAPHFTTPDPRPLLICFSHLRWNFVWQRPQHLMTRAQRTHDVVFFEEPIEIADGAAFIEQRKTPEGITLAIPRIPAGLDMDAQEQLIAKLLAKMAADYNRGTIVKWYYTPLALPFSAALEAKLIVYDCMDELSAFAGASPRLKRLEQALFRHAHLVFTGGHSLFEAKAAQHDNISPEPSSIDATHFGKARSLKAEPEDQRAIAQPRIGFFGVIDERMDLGLVAALAALRPHWQFVMIGPVVKIPESSLPLAPNLHWLGARPYMDLPAYLSGWYAGFMPFAINDSTRFISPTKTPEFLAAGVPVVSTAITDVVRPYGVKGLVEIASEPESFALALERAMERPRAAWLAAVDTELARTSWDLTWQRMSQQMRQTILKRTRVRTTPALAHMRAAGNV